MPYGVQGVAVINTWFADATAVAYGMVSTGYAALDAVEAGVTHCEVNQCDGTVGWGNHPDSTGETTLDAIIFDGVTMNAGAVAYLRSVGAAISSARRVMHYSTRRHRRFQLQRHDGLRPSGERGAPVYCTGVEYR